MANVLVVDDDMLLRRLLGVHLQAQGHSVSEAQSGSDAIEVLASIRPDLVILDSMMPSGDGYSVLRHINREAACEGVSVLMLSARNNSADKINALDAGAEDYMAKPFDPHELTARVRRILARKDAAA